MIGFLSLTTAQRLADVHGWLENRALASLLWPYEKCYEIYDPANTGAKAQPTNWPYRMNIATAKGCDVLVLPSQPLDANWMQKPHVQNALALLKGFTKTIVLFKQDGRPEYNCWQQDIADLAPRARIWHFSPAEQPLEWIRALVQILRPLAEPKPIGERHLNWMFANYSSDPERLALLEAYLPGHTHIVGTPIGKWHCLEAPTYEQYIKHCLQHCSTLLHCSPHHGPDYPVTRIAEAIAFGQALFIPDCYNYDWLGLGEFAVLKPGTRPTWHRINSVAQGLASAKYGKAPSPYASIGAELS